MIKYDEFWNGGWQKMILSNFFSTNFNMEIESIIKEFITLLRLYNVVDIIQSMNGIVCWHNLMCLEIFMTKKV